MPPRIRCVTHLEELFKRGVHHGVGNKRQSIEREKLRGLAQCCPFGLQVGFEIKNPLTQVLFVLQRRKDAHLGSPAGRPVPLSIPPSLRGSSSSSHVAGILSARSSKHAVAGHANTTPTSPLTLLCQQFQRTRYTVRSAALLLYNYHVLISLKFFINIVPTGRTKPYLVGLTQFT